MPVYLYRIEKTEEAFDTTGIAGRIECDGSRLAVEAPSAPSFSSVSGFTVLGPLTNAPANRPQVPWSIISWGA